MGFFALLARPDTGAYDVQACHINVWSLSGLYGRPMLFDVGVRFAATSDVKGIEVALPIDSGKISDLSDMVTNHQHSTLIFGKDFDRASPGKLKLHSVASELVVPTVNEHRCQQDPDASEKGLSVVRVSFNETTPTGSEAYVRIRFVADGVGDMWRWRRVLGRRNGLLIDFRSPDPREGSTKTHRHDLTARALPINNLDVFFMLPDRFQLQVARPNATYVRTLEGRQWSEYLRRSPTWRWSRQRILVYRWYEQCASKDHIFRGFMQLNRYPAFRSTTDNIIGALLVAGLAYALFRPLELRQGLNDAAGDVADAVWSTVLLVVAIGGVLGVSGLFVISKVRKTGSIWRSAKRWFKAWIEYRIFKIQK